MVIGIIALVLMAAILPLQIWSDRCDASADARLFAALDRYRRR